MSGKEFTENLVYSFVVAIVAKNNFETMLKSFIVNALKSKAANLNTHALLCIRCNH